MFRYAPANPWTRGIAGLDGKPVAQEELEARRARVLQAARRLTRGDVWLIVHLARDGTPLHLEHRRTDAPHPGDDSEPPFFHDRVEALFDKLETSCRRRRCAGHWLAERFAPETPLRAALRIIPGGRKD